MQCAYTMSYVARPALQYFSTLSHKRRDFRKSVLNTKYVSQISLQHSTETFFILGRNERDMIKHIYRSSCKVLLILVRF